MPNPVIFAPGTIQRLRTFTMRCLYFLERDPGAERAEGTAGCIHNPFAESEAIHGFCKRPERVA